MTTATYVWLLFLLGDWLTRYSIKGMLLIKGRAILERIIMNLARVISLHTIHRPPSPSSLEVKLKCQALVSSLFTRLLSLFVKWKSLSCVQLLAAPWTSPWNSPDQNTGMDSLSLLQGIFPTQGSSPGLPHCEWILYQLSYQGSPLWRRSYSLLLSKLDV